MVYPFHGENDYLIWQEILSIAQRTECEVRQIEEVGIGLGTQLQQQVLFGKPPLYVIKNQLQQLTPLFPNQTAYLNQQDMARAEPQGPTLIFWETKLDRRQKVARWLLQRAQVKEFKPLRRPQVVNWIRAWVQEHGTGECAIQPAAVEELVGRHGTDLYQLENELKKLLLFTQPGTIGLLHVQTLSSRTTEEKVFVFTDLVGARRRKEALGRLEELFEHRLDPWFLWAMIARQLRLILTFLVEGKLMGQPPFVQRKVSEQAAYWNLTELKKKLTELVGLEYRIKQGRSEVTHSLFLFCAGL